MDNGINNRASIYLEYLLLDLHIIRRNSCTSPLFRPHAFVYAVVCGHSSQRASNFGGDELGLSAAWMVLLDRHVSLAAVVVL